MKIPGLNEMLEKAQDRIAEEAEAMLYEDAFCQWLREHSKGQDVHEFFIQLEASSFSTANSVDEFFAALGW